MPLISPRDALKTCKALLTRPLAADLARVDSALLRLDRLETAKADHEAALMNLCGQLLQQRRVMTTTAPGDGPTAPPTAPTAAMFERPLALDDAYAELERLAPAAFRAWRRLVDVNAEAYEGFPIDSCSVEHHPLGELFRCFLTPYLRGRVLDVGCGPQPVPWYLEGHPLGAVYGVDPLGDAADHPFVFFRGIAEFLPWADGQFDLVVVGTSLDHVLLLDRALSEIRRVLTKPGGRAALWVSFVPGSPRYDPYAERVEPIDAYHLFHFDRPWFEEAIAPLFSVEERFFFPAPQASAFYTLAPKPGPGSP